MRVSRALPARGDGPSGGRRGAPGAGAVAGALAAALVVASLASCGGSGEAASSGHAGGNGRDIPAVGLSGPGSPLAEGLVVPAGMQLVGPVFPRPRPVGADRSTVAVLVVDGNPFTAWDDLAGQARTLGAPLPGSGVCAWHDEVTEQGGPVPPVLVTEPRPAGTDTLRCSAVAHGPGPGGELVSVTADLRWDGDGGELGLEVAAGEVLGVGDDAVTAGEDGDTHASPDVRGPAPAFAADQLPPRGGMSHAVAEAGDPFGRETNCVEGGYARLRVPPGARLVGGETAPVLAVADARAALDDLAAQVDPSGPDAGEGSATIERVDVPGAQVWRLVGEVGAGGGSCEMWSSPDGRAVLVTVWND